METKGSLPCSQEPITGPDPERDRKCIQSTTSHTNSRRTILILSSNLRIGLQRAFFPSDFWYPFLNSFLPYISLWQFCSYCFIQAHWLYSFSFSLFSSLKFCYCHFLHCSHYHHLFVLYSPINNLLSKILSEEYFNTGFFITLAKHIFC